MNILFLITARSGSKGVPNKNTQKLGGIPLLAYKAIAALKSNYCTRLIISTDCEIIAKVAEEYGVEAPFIRPKHLATDEANSMEVVLHAMKWIEKNDEVQYDALGLLQPSSPFLTYEDINNTVDLYIKRNAIGVIGVKQVDTNSIFISEMDDDLCMKKHFIKMKSFYHTRRQDIKPEYTMNGAIYLANWKYLKENKTFHSEKTYGYIMPTERSIDIDTVNDFYYAQFLIEKNIVDLDFWNY